MKWSSLALCGYPAGLFACLWLACCAKARANYIIVTLDPSLLYTVPYPHCCGSLHLHVRPSATALECSPTNLPFLACCRHSSFFLALSVSALSVCASQVVVPVMSPPSSTHQVNPLSLATSFSALSVCAFSHVWCMKLCYHLTLTYLVLPLSLVGLQFAWSLVSTPLCTSPCFSMFFFIPLSRNTWLQECTYCLFASLSASTPSWCTPVATLVLFSIVLHSVVSFPPV